MERMMTDMEMQVAGEIVVWAVMNTTLEIGKGTPSELSQAFWNDQFASCTMGNPETGMEIIDNGEFVQ